MGLAKRKYLMSRTLRTGSDYKKTEKDGKGRWRGCGDKTCPWCIGDRTNNTRRIGNE